MSKDRVDFENFTLLKNSPLFRCGEDSGRVYVEYCQRSKALAFDVALDCARPEPFLMSSFVETQLRDWIQERAALARKAGWELLSRSELRTRKPRSLAV